MPKNENAVALGKLGGSKVSPKKTEAARKNWKKAQEALAKKKNSN